jgi:hypothetical protein
MSTTKFLKINPKRATIDKQTTQNRPETTVVLVSQIADCHGFAAAKKQNQPAIVTRFAFSQIVRQSLPPRQFVRLACSKTNRHKVSAPFEVRLQPTLKF